MLVVLQKKTEKLKVERIQLTNSCLTNHTKTGKANKKKNKLKSDLRIIFWENCFWMTWAINIFTSDVLATISVTPLKSINDWLKVIKSMINDWLKVIKKIYSKRKKERKNMGIISLLPWEVFLSGFELIFGDKI